MYNNNQNANYYFENSIKTASPAKLVELLYQNSIERINKAIKSIENKNLSEANKQIIRVEDIVTELNVSLNLEKGGEVAKNLRALYNYMYQRLLESNTKKDIEILKEVRSLLQELLDTWKELLKKEVKTSRELNVKSVDPKFDLQY
ncbi:flagellar export chaperone FliS [Petrotoga olearia]|uniref:Flagellar secretion chaperone FliS n=2 Tax=Petrotoga olearia TaxID=156203 RepID=A0A2K1NZU3_9BACT|nr:flagellar export chaperone FliS [Petrotoga olearia]PNR96049.1 flagellar biosynthesis protein FliS [Petrotoga olearia DSM 13574]RMA71464.1 flagellar protein FliS [Petrotoga olearia]